jgi:hypothetical protein
MNRPYSSVLQINQEKTCMTLELFSFPIFWPGPNEGYYRNVLCALN